MKRKPTSPSDAAPPEPLATLVATHEYAVDQVREGGRPADIIVSARQAADAIQRRVTNPMAEVSSEERQALIAVKRFLFNAAADCWPGWSTDSARASDAELEEAMTLARRSLDLVDRIGLGPMEEGTARWLVGAFELALRRFDLALASFSRAETLYEQASTPGLTLLARGYRAITCEAAGRPTPPGASLDEILEAITARNLEDSKEFNEQLITAHRIFA